MEPKALRRPLTRSPRRRQFPAHTILGMSPNLLVTGNLCLHSCLFWTCNHVSDVVHLCLHLWDASGGGNGRRHVARLQSRCLHTLRLLCAQHPRLERHLHHCTTKLLRCLTSRSWDADTGGHLRDLCCYSATAARVQFRPEHVCRGDSGLPGAKQCNNLLTVPAK